MEENNLRTANVNALRELAAKYNDITLQDINRYKKFNPSAIMRRLTGYGHTEACIVCKSIIRICGLCFWNDESVRKSQGIVTKHYCCCIRYKTYNNIREAKDSEQLLEALKARAKDINNLLDSYSESFMSQGEVE